MTAGQRAAMIQIPLDHGKMTAWEGFTQLIESMNSGSKSQTTCFIEISERRLVSLTKSADGD